MAERFLMSRQAAGFPPMPLQSPDYLAENLAPRFLTVITPMFAIAMITVLARFYIRIFIMKIFGWDDVMMAISACISASCLGLVVKLADLGLGRHAEAFPLRNMFTFFKFMFFYSVLIITAYSFIKLSIGFFLLRLADRTRWRPFLIGMLVFIGVFTIGSTFAIIFQCTPLSATWDFRQRQPMGNARCYDGNIYKNVGVFNSSINIATDLLFALIPIPLIWRLQIDLQTRVGLAIILSLGLFASAVAIYKTPMQVNFFEEMDWSGSGSWYYVWQQVEMNVGIIAANLSTLKPLFVRISGRVRTFKRSRSIVSCSDPSVSDPSKPNRYWQGLVGNVERGDQWDWEMCDISVGTEPAKEESYDDILVLGRESNGADIETDGRQSAGGASDEIVLSPERPFSLLVPGTARNMTILKTTEVRMSDVYEDSD